MDASRSQKARLEIDSKGAGQRRELLFQIPLKPRTRPPRESRDPVAIILISGGE